MVVTLAEFSRMKGISKPSATNAVKSGRIVRTPDGKVDTEDPLNAVYTPRRKADTLGPVIPKPAKMASEAPAVADDSDLEMEPTDPADDVDGIPDSQLILAKIRGEVRHRATLERLAALRLETAKENLVPKELFIAAVQGMNAAIDSHLHRLPAKVGPVLYALARRDGSAELEVIRTLETEMGQAIRRAVEDVARLQP